MNWFEIIGAIGIGSVIGVFITSLINIYLQKMKEKAEIKLQRMKEKEETKKWLRAKRLKAFSKLSKELLTLRLHKKGIVANYNPFEFLAIATESIILIEEKELKNRIVFFIIKLKDFYEKAKIGEKTTPGAGKLWKLAGEIVNELSATLIGNR